MNDHNQSFNNKNISGLDNLTGQEFEKFCVKILKKRGYYNISLTPASGDFGIDIIAYSMGVKFAIRCKRSKTKIGNKAVQEALSGKVYYKCDIAVVASNNYFTKQAIETAKATDVVLWDRDMLIKMIFEAGLKIKRVNN